MVISPTIAGSKIDERMKQKTQLFLSLCRLLCPKILVSCKSWEVGGALISPLHTFLGYPKASKPLISHPHMPDGPYQVPIRGHIPNGLWGADNRLLFPAPPPPFRSWRWVWRGTQSRGALVWGR